MKYEPILTMFDPDFLDRSGLTENHRGGQNGWGGRFLTKLISRVKSRQLKDFGGIAQLVERLVRNEKARGSNPLTSSLRSQRWRRA